MVAETGIYEKNGKKLIIDFESDKEVYYRTWVDGDFNGLWRKPIDDFYAELNAWLVGDIIRSVTDAGRRDD